MKETVLTMDIKIFPETQKGYSKFTQTLRSRCSFFFGYKVWCIMNLFLKIRQLTRCIWMSYNICENH
jgi:hypothetical protein